MSVSRPLTFTLRFPGALAVFFLGIVSSAEMLAQPPRPSPARLPTPTKSSATPSPSPPSTPTKEELINELTPADLQSAIGFFKNNFANPGALSEVELNRALVEGLMTRHNRGAMLLPAGASASGSPPSPFYSEILEGHIGYLRLGTLNSANLQELDKALPQFVSKKVDAIILDLRGSSESNDFAIAAEIANRFCSRGKPLFSLHKPGARQDRMFNSDRNPAFQGLTVVLTDGETAGGAEAVAGALRMNDKALIIGEPTAGRAAEYSDLQLPSGKILRLAAADAVLPDGQQLFPDGIKPDVPVEMSIVNKRQIFQLSAQNGLGPFVYEAERPHMNEAALIAGTNPELDAAEAEQRRRQPGASRPAVHDVVLQRALDLVTSVEIYQKR